MSNGANSWEGDEYSQNFVDQIAVMVAKENTFYSCVDYLGKLSESRRASDAIDVDWRQNTAEWMFKVIDFYVSTSAPLLLYVANESSHLLSHYTYGLGFGS